jgi:hypothetical protein
MSKGTEREKAQELTNNQRRNDWGRISAPATSACRRPEIVGPIPRHPDCLAGDAVLIAPVSRQIPC